MFSILIVDLLQSGDSQSYALSVIATSIITFSISLALRITIGGLYKASKKAIELWAEDAILTCGVLKCIDFGYQKRTYQITVNHKKGKETIVSPSENLHKVPFRLTRYLTLLHNSTIPVLYSPKYNQILLIETNGKATEVI